MTKQEKRNLKKILARDLIDRARVFGFIDYEARQRFKDIILKYGANNDCK
ncbi:MAG: hypothetical protein WA063_05240 [Minisyncoccia bacterium]